MDQQHPTENGNETLPELPDQGQRDGSYEEAKNKGTADQSSLEDPPNDGQSSSDASVDGADDAGGTEASGQAGTYSDKGTDAVDETVPVQD